ncbi:ABC transporter substrate-binding protein [Cohnella candidum]|uniref:Sugar ABC transporter substrate-binding protein n=1 Tax=Cohnella candidum TaxID=2674991 RepID=A0A3G3JXQ3_9BACL|nr:sugar ABC transporter substrate-binding protein [Cohnella candidum]AYQ73026.1 sugar ABC transporter substrate-binding protein [Cohnella candidum]
MKAWKQPMSLVLVMLMGLSLILSACGGGKSDNASSSAPASSPAGSPASSSASPSGSASAEPAKDISGEITVAGWDYIQKSLSAVLPEFNKEYPNIKVNFKVAPPADHYKKLTLDLSSGQGAGDVVAIEIQNLPQYMELGALEDLSEDINAYRDKFNKYKVESATLDGKVYAMPIDSGPVGVYYRRDVFEKAGLPSDPDSVAKQLATWDSYLETAKIIKDKAGVAMLPLAGSTNDARMFQILMQQQGDWYFDKNGATAVNNDKTKKVLTLFDNLWKNGYAMDVQDWTDGWYAALKDGKVATIPAAVWMGGFLKSFIAPDTAGKWGVVPLPVWEQDGARTSNDGGSYLAIPSQSKNKEAARAFVNFMLTKDASQIALFKATDSFPSLETTYSDPYFAEKDPYFADQPYRQLFADLADEILPVNYTGKYSEANALTMTELQKLATKKQDVDATLSAIESSIKSKTGQ